MFKEAVSAPRRPEDYAEWEALLSDVAKLEIDHPNVRNHEFVAERMANSFISIISESGRPVPDDCREKITSLVLLFDRPLIAAEVLRVMLENLEDPVNGLENAIRMAEVTMNVKFTRSTQEDQK
jgi:hypothetical protein